MSSRNDENMPHCLILAYEDIPHAWYESELTLPLLASVITSFAKFTQIISHTEYNFAFRGIVTLIFLGGRFLDFYSTYQTIDVIEKANSLLPPEYQSIEESALIPDHPEPKDLHRWPTAVTEGIILGIAFSEPAIAIGVSVNSYLTALSNYRIAARSARIIEYAQAEKLPDV